MSTLNNHCPKGNKATEVNVKSKILRKKIIQD